MFNTCSGFFSWLNNVSIKLYWVFICFICCIRVLLWYARQICNTSYLIQIDADSYRILGQNYRWPSQKCSRSEV